MSLEIHINVAVDKLRKQGAGKRGIYSAEISPFQEMFSNSYISNIV